MAWSGGTYSKGNSATGGWAGDASLGIGIEAGRHDTQDNDFATGINQCLNKDGSNSATGNLNVGGYKITNMATGTASGDAVTLGQAQAGIAIQSTTVAQSRVENYSANTAGGRFSLWKSRGATIGTNTIVQANDELGSIFFNGANGSGYTNGAAIYGHVDGTPGATNDMPGRLSFYTTPDGSGTLSERMRITNDGKVGIGTGTPNETFQVASATGSTSLNRFSADVNGSILYMRKSRNASIDGNTIVQNNDSLGLVLFEGNNGTGYSRAGAIQVSVDGTPGATNDMPGRLEFFTVPDGSGTLTERMRITNGGAVCIGTTAAVTGDILTTGTGSGLQQIGVNGGSSGTGAGAGVLVRQGGTAIAAMGGYSAIYSGGAYDATPTLYFNAGPKVLGITSAVGDRFMKWSTTTNAWTYDTSSARFKDNIEDCSYGLNAVLAMQPREFDYKFEDNKHDVGFVAEELIDVIPHVVGLDKDGLPEAVMYDRLTAVLCKAIQELNSKVETLEDRIAALEA